MHCIKTHKQPVSAVYTPIHWPRHVRSRWCKIASSVSLAKCPSRFKYHQPPVLHRRPASSLLALSLVSTSHTCARVIFSPCPAACCIGHCFNFTSTIYPRLVQTYTITAQLYHIPIDILDSFHAARLDAIGTLPI